MDLLTRTLSQPSPFRLRLRRGTVSAVDAGPPQTAMVIFADGVTAVGPLITDQRYTATVGDTVMVLANGANWYVLGDTPTP
ncbi:MAG TPA: hypothetical protein VNF71_14450 [Acidimicrobiales bacterium]|nr:hypothetical protein [Acidimicrobiales bacterium]